MKLLLEDMLPEERIPILREQHDAAENTTYYRALTEEELEIKREKFFSNADKLETLNEELKCYKAAHKKETTELKEDNRVSMTEIRTKQEQRNGTLFNMANHETGYMETYNEVGEFISSRKLRPNEKQSNVFQMNRVVGE